MPAMTLSNVTSRISQGESRCESLRVLIGVGA